MTAVDPHHVRWPALEQRITNARQDLARARARRCDDPDCATCNMRIEELNEALNDALNSWPRPKGKP